MFSCVRLFANPLDVAHQASFMRLSQQNSRQVAMLQGSSHPKVGADIFCFPSLASGFFTTLSYLGSPTNYYHAINVARAWLIILSIH